MILTMIVCCVLCHRYVMDIVDDNFCSRKEIYLKYREQVYDMCNILIKVNKDYRDYIVNAFEVEDLKVVDATTRPLYANNQYLPYPPLSTTSNNQNNQNNQQYLHYWDYLNKNLVAQIAFLHERKEHICTAVGACVKSDFEIPMTPIYRQQEFWNETCFVCQAAVRDMEV